MGKFSTYRYLELRDNTSVTHINTRSRTVKQPRGLRKAFILLIVIVLCVTYLLGLFAGQTQWLDSLAKSLGYESVYHHAVIIDAGSSGTRVLAYKFRVPFTVFGPINLELIQEYFEQSKPGLSSYADDPVQGADTIVQLVKKAEFMLPADKRRQTPLLVRATAGLRLLPAEKAQSLIDHVADAISTLGYLTDPQSVAIMDGSDEGIFIWYTVNLLHNLMDSDSMAALDLGGGSTQITFRLNDREADKYPAPDRFIVPAGGSNITLYTHSYLKLGLHAARYGVFMLEAQEQGVKGNATTNEFTSVCVEPIIQREHWFYDNKHNYVSGASIKGLKREAIMQRCRAVVARYVAATLDRKPAPLIGRVAAMSYFYDVAADAGLIDVENGGTVSIQQYRGAALKGCSNSNVEQPWACLDLVYIITLLHDAYKIRLAQPVSLFRKIEGHEVSWALGLAYTTVMNRLAAAGAAATAA